MNTWDDARPRAWARAAWAVLAACAVWPALTLLTAADERPDAAGPVAHAADASRLEWPQAWDGRALRPLATSAVEARFAEQFPGRLARLTDGEQVLMWRAVARPTRMLHPAADCYRALGYRVEHTRLERDAQTRLWRCFEAGKDGRRLRVCERIEDASGREFTDTSAWYWAATLGESTGPWQAITTARPL